MAPHRAGKIAAAALLVGLVVLVAGYLALGYLGIDATREVAVQRLEKITGREVAIQGDFSLVPSLAPTVAAEGIAVANAAWASDEPMLEADRIEVAFQLIPLLWRGDLLIDRLAISGADLLLETGAEGRANWRFGPAAPEAEDAGRGEFLLADVTIQDSRLHWRGPDDGPTEAVVIDRLAWQAPALTSEVALTGSGQALGQPFELSGELGPLAGLIADQGSYPVSLEGALGPTSARIEGAVGLADDTLALAIAVSGERLARLSELIEPQLPELGPYAVEGVLAGSLEAPALIDLAGRIGDPATLHVELQDGRIGDLLALEDIEVVLELRGPRFAALGEVLEAELPELGRYEFQGTLTGSTEALALVALRGEVGEEGAPELRISDGAITDVRAGEGVLADVEAEGAELADLAAALGIEMPPFGPYAAEGRLEGSFASLALRDAEATAGDPASRLSLAGSIGELLELQSLDLSATAKGSDLAALSPLVGFALPATEAYRIAGQITGSIEDLRVDDLEAEIADSRLDGWLSVQRFAAEPPRIEGELVAERLDVDSLLGLAEREPGAAEATVEPADAAGGPMPGEPLPLEWLDELEAELAVRVDALLVDRTAFEDASFSLALQEGRLSVQDLVLRVAGGSLAGGAALEARDEDDLAEVTVRLSAHGVDVGQVLKDWTATEKVAGELDIDVNLDATGRSVDELLASLEGSAAVVGEDGQIKDAPLDLLVTDLDILRALPPFWRGGEDHVRVNCMIVEMDIEDGVAQTEAMLDTQRMTLLGQGTIDLGEMQLDLALRPKAKQKKLSRLAVPVDITGSFAEPEVNPRAGRAVGQAIRGVLGGLLIPLNQLSALFGQDTVDACRQALEQVGERPDPAAAGESPS